MGEDSFLFSICRYKHSRVLGLFAPNAGQQVRADQRGRRSQYDRGTSLAELDEYNFDAYDASEGRAFSGYRRAYWVVEVELLGVELVKAELVDRVSTQVTDTSTIGSKLFLHRYRKWDSRVQVRDSSQNERRNS